MHEHVLAQFKDIFIMTTQYMAKFTLISNPNILLLILVYLLGRNFKSVEYEKISKHPDIYNAL